MRPQEFFDDKSYPILSHRWEEDELTYQDLQTGQNRAGTGFAKVKKCCENAWSDHFAWVWVDTCCIDKLSNAELSEAIDATFKWHKGSLRCYAYLSDVHAIVNGSGRFEWPTFKQSLWFTRGWTLQESIAPFEVFFLDCAWRVIGMRTDLMKDVTAVTGIPQPAFTSFRQYSIAQSMSWASKRQTSRVEDMAYCLLGIFDAGLPLLDGEGEPAFKTLQDEVLRSSDDESIFVWMADPHEEAMAVEKLQDDILIGMNREGPLDVPTRKRGLETYLPQDQVALPTVLAFATTHSLTDRLTYLLVKICGYVQCFSWNTSQK